MNSDRYPLLPLRRIGSLVGGGTPTSNSENWNGSVPFVTPPDLRPVTGGLVVNTVRFLTEEGAASGSSVVPADSVILSIRAPIGYVARTGMRAAFNQGCRAIVPRASMNSRYLTYALVAAGPELESLGRGTTFMELSATQMAALEVPVPTLDEQRAIANYLDRETARIDTLIDEQQRLIKTLRERRRAIVEEAVAIVDTSGTRLKHMIRSVRQGWSPQCCSWPADGIETWAVLKAGAANGGRFRPMENKELPEDEIPRPEIVVSQGDLLVSRANTRELVGSAAVVEEDFPRLMLCDKLYAFTLDENRAEPQFVAAVLGSRRWRDLIELAATGTSHSMLNISQSDIVNLPMQLPSVDEQRRLKGYLRSETAKIDKLVAETERLIELARERRSALIAAAVTGQIGLWETT
ncbi:restriction endonuclease subunit S [Rhodococcus coprophilus]|nr:restriction endonuclease subunit S [Rhodococcus coprophilus]